MPFIMDHYIQLMAVNQSKWLTSQKNVSDLEEEIIRQKKWLSEHSLSSKYILPPTGSNSKFKSSNEQPIKSFKQLKSTKLCTIKANKDEKKLSKSKNKSSVKVVPLKVAVKKEKESLLKPPKAQTADIKIIKRPSSLSSSSLPKPPSPKNAQLSRDNIEINSEEHKIDVINTAIKNENNIGLSNSSSKPLDSTNKKEKINKSHIPKKMKEKNNEELLTVEEATPKIEKPKKERHYDVEATRNYMKQKRTERQQKTQLVKNNNKSKVKDRSDIKKKLDDLRNKQLNILKNSTKRKSNELPEWVGLGSGDKTDTKDMTNEVPEPILTASERNIQKPELSTTKPRRQNMSQLRKKPECPTVNPVIKQPATFFVDVNFPAEFLTDDVPVLTQNQSNRSAINSTNMSRGKTPISKVTSNVAATKCKTSVDKQPPKNDIDKIFQDEIKQGLEATNEFMQQVSEQMKLLTEHFTLLGSSKSVEPAGKSIAVQSSSFKDIAVQAFSSSLSESSQGNKVQQNKEVEDISYVDEWKEILPAMMEELKLKKTCNQKPTILSELFCEEELSAFPDSIKSQELLSVVRKKLDFIEQDKAQEKMSLDCVDGIQEKDPLIGCFPLRDTDLTKITPIKECLSLTKDGEIICDDPLLKSTLKLSETPLLQNYQKEGSLKIDIKKDDKNIRYKDNGDGDGKSDTTISESLSTDPLKLPYDVENLSISVEALKKNEGINTLSDKRRSKDENMPLMVVKLDTGSIEGLHIQAQPLFETKNKSRSISSRSFSEIPEKISYDGSQSASKSSSHNSSKNDLSPRTLLEISENLRRSNSGRSNLSKVSSINDFKSIKESFEKLHSSKSEVKPLANHATCNFSHKDKPLKTSRKEKHSSALKLSKEIMSENYELNRGDGLFAEVPRRNGSMEDIRIIKSDFSQCSSHKSYSEKKSKEKKHYRHNKYFEKVTDSRNIKPVKSLDNLMPDNQQSKDLYKKISERLVDSDHTSTISENSQKMTGEVCKIASPIKFKNIETSGIYKSDSNQHNAQKYSTDRASLDDLRIINSDSQGFELLQPTPKVIKQHSSNSKRRTSSERNVQEMFIHKVPLSSISSNSAQVGSMTFQELIMKEMENLDAVNTNLSHALARNRVLSSENIVHFSCPSTSSSICVGDNHYYPLQLSHSDTTNNQSNISSGFEAGKELNSGLVDDRMEDPSYNLPKFSLRMLENLLIDEESRYRNQSSLLDLRYQAVLEKTQAELTMLSVEKAKHKAKGNEEILRNIKKRERGIILKCQQDFKDIKRLHEVGREASRDRILLIKSQIHLLKSHLNSNKYAQKFHSSNVNKNMKKSGHSPSKSNKFNSKSAHFTTHANLECQKRELERREALLAARRQSLEAVMTWTRRVEDEEKRLKDVEKMIALSSGIRQGTKEGVDRGTSPLNLVSDSEFVANKTVESSASSSEQPADTKLNRKSISEKSADNYSDTFEQITMSERVPRIKCSENTVNDSTSRRRTTIAIKVPLAPRCPPTKRRHSSGSDESILYSQNETSETSDIEVRVSSLQQQLKQRKSELEILKRQHSKSQHEKLRATEQALISQINAYDGYIEQLKNDIKQELDNGAIKVMKPQIKQPKVAERRKSDHLTVTEKKKESELTKESTSEDLELSESTESVKTLIESPRILEDAFTKSIAEDSFKTDFDTQASTENKLESLELDETYRNAISDSIQNDNSLKSISDCNKSDIICKEDTEILSIEDSNILTHVDSNEKIWNHDVSPTSCLEADDFNQNKQPDSELIPEIKDSVSEEALKEECSYSDSAKSDNNFKIQSGSKEIQESKCYENELNHMEESESLISSATSQNTSHVLDEIEKEAIFKSELSSVADSEEVKTESLLKSFVSSDDKDILKSPINLDIENNDKHESLINDIEPPDVSLSYDKSESDIESSVDTNLSNIDQLNSDILPNLDISPASSSLHSEENIHLMSAALMRAIESTKEEAGIELEISGIDNLTTHHSKDQNVIESSVKGSICDDLKRPINEHQNGEVKDLKILEVKLPKDEIQYELKEEEIPEEIEEVHSPISEHNISSNPCDKTFIINDESDKNLNDGVSEDLMLQMISDSLSDSERLWNLNLEEYRKIREETPFLTALQRENDLSNTIDDVSQHIFRNLFERSISDVLEVYFNKRESSFKVHLMEDGYHVPDFDYCEEPLKEAEEDKLWCNAFRKGKKETSSSQDEAEKLRLKQLQIEQEIEELEAAGMRGFYLREIPNKPPPPYTPPRPVKSRLTSQVVSLAVDIGISALWESESDGLSSLRPPSTFLPDITSSSSDIMLRDMMWDLCVELYHKALPPPPPPCPPWILASKRNKLAQPLRSKEKVTSWCMRQALIILGFEQAVKKESMVIRWSHKKRDRVDKILLKENQDEESSWVDYAVEENIIKNRIAELIIDDTISNASAAFVNAFLSKLPS